jgi:pilus assembly protein Flp/PilA
VPARTGRTLSGELPAVIKYLNTVRRFLTRLAAGKEQGATLAEYGLLLALIAVICIAAISLLGNQISSMFSTLSTSV